MGVRGWRMGEWEVTGLAPGWSRLRRPGRLSGGREAGFLVAPSASMAFAAVAAAVVAETEKVPGEVAAPHTDERVARLPHSELEGCSGWMRPRCPRLRIAPRFHRQAVAQRSGSLAEAATPAALSSSTLTPSSPNGSLRGWGSSGSRPPRRSVRSPKAMASTADGIPERG